MSAEPMRGVFPILVTPFDKRDRVGGDSLQNLVDHCIDAVARATRQRRLIPTQRKQIACNPTHSTSSNPCSPTVATRSARGP